MTQACTLFLANHHRLKQRCLDIACNKNVQDINKLNLRLCLDSFHLPMAIHVWLLEVITVNCLNAFEQDISTFYVVSCLHRLVVTSGTSLLSLRFHPIHTYHELVVKIHFCFLKWQKVKSIWTLFQNRTLHVIIKIYNESSFLHFSQRN